MSKEDKEPGMSTRSVHAGEQVDPSTGSITTPLIQTAVFGFRTIDDAVKSASGQSGADLYTRWSNPTVRIFESKIASLERVEDCAAFSSGMAAISTAVMTLISKGGHIVATRDLYGETIQLFSEMLPKYGVETSLADATDVESIRKAIRPNTKIVYFESPTNPTLKLVDIRAVAKLANQKSGMTVMMDNTFATPINQRPAEMGVDLVIHSTTKFIAGHSDVMGGAVAGPKHLVEKVKLMRRILGGILDPHAAWLQIRSLRTLAVRIERVNSTCFKLAKFLERHSQVVKVNYPGLESQPQHALARKQMKGYGGTLSFEVRGGLETAKKMVQGIKIGVLAANLGGVETIITHPATMTHMGLTGKERLKAGIRDELVRVSVGMEDPEDLIADFGQALDRAG